MPIQRIHHVAYRCKTPNRPCDWYREHLGMDFVLAIAEDQVPSTPRARPLHARLHGRRRRQRAGLLRAAQLGPPWAATRTRPTGCSTSPSRWAAWRSWKPPRPNSKPGGIPVVGPTDHTIFKSIYFFDPNGHRLELAADTATPEMSQRSTTVKWAMLDEWAQHQARAQHAAWMHEKEFTAPWKPTSARAAHAQHLHLPALRLPPEALAQPKAGWCSATRGGRRRRAGGPDRRHRPGAARPAGAAAGRRRHRQHRLARPCYAKRALEVLDRLGWASRWSTRA
jgi:catechol 2,3-dioxygenase-like lactoylglutathione lyase family enzyme